MIETATADNQLLNAIKIKKASLSSYFEEATHYVEFEFSKETGEWWGIKENGYLAFRFRGKFYRFNIVKFKEDVKTNSISILGDYFNLEMLNENCLAYEKQPSRTIVQHLVAMEILPYANFEIGVNELASSSRVVEYTGEEMKYKRLISLINNFDGECQFEIRQKRNGEFDKLILNIYKANDGEKIQGVGRNRRDLELNIDNTNNISRSVDSTTIRTAIEPTGKDGLRLGNSGKTWRNNDGRVEFEQKDGRIYAVIAAEETTRVLSNDKWLVWKQNFDTDSLDKLESESYKWIKNNCYAKETIEVAGSFDVEIGDTVILNHKGVGRYGLLGTLRVVKIVWDLLTEENEVSFANFKRLSSKISAQGLALQESIETPASYDITFNTTAGQVFKNNTGASIVSFNFKKNGLDAAVIGQRWYNGTQLLSNGLEFMVKPANLTNDLLTLRLEVDVTTGITFSKEITFLNVNDGAKGDTGNGVVSTENYYLVSTNKTGITSETTGWIKDTPQVATPTNKYHWHYHIDIYSNGTRKETIPAIIGIYGDKGADGVGINSLSIMYGVSASATVQPTNWTEAMPVAKQGEYLWKRTITDYTDPTKSDTIELTYNYQGKDGTPGTSLTVSKTEYQAGTSGTVAPTGTWTIAIPTVADGQFLWMKATMSDNSTIIVPTKQGAKGKDGISVTNNIPSYVLSTNGTTAPTTGWSSSIPTLIKGQFLWTKNDLTLSDSTTKTSYSVTYIPNDGINGQTPVVHTAYANSQNGAVDFSITDSTNRRYIGQYTDYTSSDSTDPNKYKWIDMVGSVQVGGVNLLKNSSFALNFDKWDTWASTPAMRAIISNGVGKIDGAFQATSTVTQSILDDIKYDAIDTIYTASIYLKATNITLGATNPLLQIYIDGYYNESGASKWVGNVTLKKDAWLTENKLQNTGWIKYSLTFKVNVDRQLLTSYGLRLYTRDFTGTIEFKNFKLEQGNIPTPWTSAPEDIDAKIDTKADQLYTQQQILALEEKTTLERENAIAEAMQNTISEVEQKWQLWYDTNTKDEKQQVANDIASLMQRTAELDYKLGEASAKFSFINNETIIGEDGVAIGDKAGKAKLFMSGDSISFLTNGVAQMTLTGDTLSIKNGLFTERIQIGNFVEEVYDKNPLFNVIRAIKNS